MALWLLQLTEQEGVRALVTMNEESELLPNLLCTPVTPCACLLCSAWIQAWTNKTPSAEWQGAQVEQCFGVTADFSPPTVETIHRYERELGPLAVNVIGGLIHNLHACRCVEFVHKHVDLEKRTTYVHCKAGRGRSTVIVVAFLMKYRGMTVDEGYSFIRTKRRHVSLHPKQRAILHEFARTIGKAEEEQDKPKIAEPSSEPEATTVSPSSS